MYVCICMYVCVCMHVYACMCMYVYVCMYVYMYVYMYMYVCIYIYTTGKKLYPELDLRHPCPSFPEWKKYDSSIGLRLGDI